MEIISQFPKYEFDLSKLTCCNTHGDYMINQLLCGKDCINGVINWTTSCVHPVVWEIIRFYVYASPLCVNGEIDIKDFCKYVKEYMKGGKLTWYDLENMGKVFYYFLAVCYFYDQYYESMSTNRDIFLKQAIISSKLLVWLKENIDVLTEELVKLDE